MGESQLSFLTLDVVCCITSLSGKMGVLVHEWNDYQCVAMHFLIGF